MGFVQTYEMSEFVGKNFELIKNSPTYQGWLTLLPTYIYDDEPEDIEDFENVLRYQSPKVNCKFDAGDPFLHEGWKLYYKGILRIDGQRIPIFSLKDPKAAKPAAVKAPKAPKAAKKSAK